MESHPNSERPKVKKISRSQFTTQRIRKETNRLLQSLLSKANKKKLGRKLTVDEIISFSLKLINETHIKDLQESTLSNQDRLEQSYREYCSQHGSVSKDQFLGQLLKSASFVGATNE